MDGEVGPVTSNLLLALHTADGYVDDGKPAADLGYLYKVRRGMQAGCRRDAVQGATNRVGA